MSKVALTQLPDSRLGLAFRRDAQGFWLGSLHVCGDMMISLTRDPHKSGNWCKGCIMPTHAGGCAVFLVDRDAVAYDIDGTIDLLAQHLWINDSLEGRDAFQALLLSCWTELSGFSASPPKKSAISKQGAAQ